MYYWSRWTNIPTTETRVDESQETHYASWRDTAPRLEAQRETRPVVVVARRTQPLSALSTSRRERFQRRETSPGITLDVQRSLYASTRSCAPAGRQHEATTQPVVEAFRLK
jgi:hypothetical protein